MNTAMLSTVRSGLRPAAWALSAGVRPRRALMTSSIRAQEEGLAKKEVLTCVCDPGGAGDMVSERCMLAPLLQAGVHVDTRLLTSRVIAWSRKQHLHTKFVRNNDACDVWRLLGFGDEVYDS